MVDLLFGFIFPKNSITSATGLTAVSAPQIPRRGNFLHNQCSKQISPFFPRQICRMLNDLTEILLLSEYAQYISVIGVKIVGFGATL